MHLIAIFRKQSR